MAVSLMLVLSVLGAARARPEMRTPKAGVAVRSPVPQPEFSFAPMGGQKMGAACACTSPTGTRGESINFGRGSSAYCTKGGISSNIANGDLVLCSSNQARVMPGGDGLGPLGLLMEPAATNNITYSQEIGGTGWTTGGTAPTITVNNATAPDGTTTATRIAFPAVTAGVERSIVFNSTAASMTTAIGSVYIKGVSGSGTMYMNVFNNSGCGGSAARVECSFNSTTWTRCSTNVETTNALRYLVLGPDRQCNTGTDSSPAQSVYVWQAQLESGAYATTPIVTVAAAATRAQDIAYVTGLSGTGTTSRMSISGNVYQLNGSTPPADSYYMTVQQSDAHAYSAFFYSGGLPYCGNPGANDRISPAPSGGPTSWWCSFDTSASNRITGQVAGTNTTTNLDGALTSSNAAKIGIGLLSGTPGQGGAVYKDLCYDKNELRCR